MIITKKLITNITFISLMGNMLYATAQITPTNISTAIPDDELQRLLAQSQEEKELFTKLANSGIYALISTTQNQVQTTTAALSKAQRKIKSILDEFTTTTTPDTLISQLTDLLATIKSTGLALITHVSNHVNELYAPIAHSSMITDDGIKSRITAHLEPQNSTQSQQPIQAQLQQGTQALQPARVEKKDSKPKTGVEGLYQFITERNVKGLSNEEKEQIVAEIKKNNIAIQEFKDTFNKAAKAAVDQLGLLKNIDQTSIAALHTSFTLPQDADYETTPPLTKYETLVKAYVLMTETIKSITATISIADAGIIKFVGILFGTLSTDTIFVELKNLITKQQETIDSTNELFDKVKTNIDKANKIIGQPTQPESK